VTKVVGIRFKKAGKIYYFDPGDFAVKKVTMPL
jgi:cell fate regulator YaaT (PSP1 superfamily)